MSADVLYLLLAQYPPVIPEMLFMKTTRDASGRVLKCDECVSWHLLKTCFSEASWESIRQCNVLSRKNRVVDSALDVGAHDSTSDEKH